MAIPVTALSGDCPRCPVCAGACVPLGAVDFNKCCAEVRGTQLPPSRRLVHYILCTACGFCWAPEFSTWTPADFEREIYNADYARVDPDHAEVRPRASAESLLATFGDHGRPASHLDYGGGPGLLSRLLREERWQSTSCDPFFDRNVQLSPPGKFQLITCYEVFEHVPDGNQLAMHLSSLLTDDGLVLLSTLLSDGQLAVGQPITWWYASPRNGHISLHSARSLDLLAQRHGFRLASFSPDLHFLWRGDFPQWARHLLQGS